MRYLGILLCVAMAAVPALAVEADVLSVVPRAQFTTGIMDREPVDEITVATNDTAKLVYFSEILNMEGQTVRHRWLYEGEVRAEVSFDIGGPRWRVWSSKEMLPGWTGQWTVQIVDENDQVLSEQSLLYEPAGESPDRADSETAD